MRGLGIWNKFSLNYLEGSCSHQECYISPLENIISSASAFLEFLECTVTASHNNVSYSPAARHGGAGGAEHEGPIHARA